MGFNTKLLMQMATPLVAAQIHIPDARQLETQNIIEQIGKEINKLVQVTDTVTANSNRMRMDDDFDIDSECLEKFEQMSDTNFLFDLEGFASETNFGDHCKMRDWLQFKCDMTDVFEDTTRKCKVQDGVPHIVKLKAECADFLGVGGISINVQGLLVCLPDCLDIESLIELLAPATDLIEDFCKIKVTNTPAPPTVSPAPTISSAPTSVSDMCLKDTNEFKNINPMLSENLDDSGCKEIKNHEECNQQNECRVYKENYCNFSRASEVAREKCVNDGGVLYRLQGSITCTWMENWYYGYQSGTSVDDWEGAYVCLADSCNLERDFEILFRENHSLPDSCTFAFESSAPTISPAPSTAFEGQCLEGHATFKEINVALGYMDWSLIDCDYQEQHNAYTCDLSDATGITKDNCTKDGGVLYKLKYTKECGEFSEVYENMYLCLDTYCDIDDYIENVVNTYLIGDYTDCTETIENDPMVPTISPAPSSNVDQCITSTEKLDIYNMLDDDYWMYGCDIQGEGNVNPNNGEYNCKDKSVGTIVNCGIIEGGVLHRFKISRKCQDETGIYTPSRYTDIYACLSSTCDVDTYAKHIENDPKYDSPGCRKLKVKLDPKCPDGKKEMSVELFTDHKANEDNSIAILRKDENDDWQRVIIHKHFKNNQLNINSVCLVEGDCYKVILKDKSRDGFAADSQGYYKIRYGDYTKWEYLNSAGKWKGISNKFDCDKTEH